jgi:hypothetical protein
MKPAVGSLMLVMQTRPPARPTISRAMISLWPEPKVWITSPRATDAAANGDDPLDPVALEVRFLGAGETEQAGVKRQRACHVGYDDVEMIDAANHLTKVNSVARAARPR